jgi:mono/diheme cytochrome c family protein
LAFARRSKRNGSLTPLLFAIALLQTPPEARWFADEADLAIAMTQAPAERLRAPDARDAYAVEAGRALFRNPYFFGGDAEEGGLSCQTCHTNGGANQDLFAHRYSDAPGRVDATSRLMGRLADNDEFDPRPIPPIAGKIGSAAHDLDNWMGEDIAAALRVYVAHLVSPTDVAPRTPSGDLGDAARAVRVTVEATRRGDMAIADAALKSARAAAASAWDRFPSPEFDEERRRLDQLTRRIDALRTGYRLNDEAAAEELARDLEAEGRTLDARRPGSYYDPATYTPILAEEPLDGL